jgi:hypothetical protein
MNLTVPKKLYVTIKKGLLRATFYIQFIVLFEFFNLMYVLLVEIGCQIRKI